MQRVGGPAAHHACRLPSKTLLVSWHNLRVEHVGNNLKQVYRCPLRGPKWNNHFESREHAENGRTSGPLCMQSAERDTIGVMASLSVEPVTLDNQGDDSEARVAPRRQGASALACRGAGGLQQYTVSNKAGTHSGIHTWHPVDRVQQSRLSSEA